MAGFGDLIVSPVARMPSLRRKGVETKHVLNVAGFTGGALEVSRIPSKRSAAAGGAMRYRDGAQRILEGKP
jgi:hypothetical protein